jgi:hypothetical protein
MFIGYNKARRSGLSTKDFLRAAPSSKSLKNPRLAGGQAVEQPSLCGPAAQALGTI